MSEWYTIDPQTVNVQIDGRTVPLSDVAQARDFVRSAHMALDPYPMVGLEVRDSRAGNGSYTISGHAAVFNRWSLDLGGFTEQVAPGFFDGVLSRSPDVHALWDHDTQLVLARTRNNTLELTVDDQGLHNWMRVAPTYYSEALRTLMERGDVDQQSFAFTVADDVWEIDEDDNVRRTLLQAGELFDVTITAKGAYPQTSAAIGRSIRQVLGEPRILAHIDLPTRESGSESGAAPEREAAADSTAAEETQAGAESRTAADEGQAGADASSSQSVEDEHVEPNPAVEEFKALSELRRIKLDSLKERLGKLS